MIVIKIILWAWSCLLILYGGFMWGYNVGKADKEKEYENESK